MERIDPNVITFLFKALHSLERCHRHSVDLLEGQSFQPESVRESLQEHAKVLEDMRVTAESLNHAWREGSELESVRLFNVFYGLNALVRPEIVSTFTSLARGQVHFDLADTSAVVH